MAPAAAYTNGGPRAVDPPKRGPEPYSKRKGKNTGSRASGKTRGISSSSPVQIRYRPEREIVVDVIFSAHSDGMMAILRKA